ncbi:tagatose 6-phosphate kinase [Amycolatopsis mediterranei S699]|uniref:Tagatose 6-phosphate kinase n=2 Tax=Amycolatopsis mediterranei TaxID=33910 RepID=A0A0H3D4V5_AMYMU|nr:PfkB family carbohydrate kinase [Amycolatopsis mediterranei]ADJ45701.1 tagatose 6-phosphate kinase [Amycolatopsis mediterranei U32]AEK42481.1 tagatose 6-phosphate kinase [Amycolatopsis mediterranei S699]AFO77412.1 tagatose 6-phosphate kinase [Amycolatopsis mediterranei S699]AGT84540.1 tagatose 6-phosphate kinase [Amycolatopsis mediterranei RB]KDO05747.1 tagatose-6-phosphate kinase [Amycolatopsis mediterranei]
MTPRIVTVTLNPAIDVTYRADALRLGGTTRVSDVRARAGGKGVNVAAVVRELGGESLVLALTTTRTPDEFRDGLDELGLKHRLVPALPAVRRTVAVVTPADGTTMVQENGFPAATSGEAGVLDALRAELAAGVGAVVISGSVPVGLGADVPAKLARLCVRHDVPVIADVSGAALREAAGSGAVLMPNEDELAELAGPGLEACEKLVAAGTPAVVATFGPDGAIAVTAEGTWRAWPAEVVSGNSAGAGDAGAAALALRLAAAGAVSEVDWPVTLADVVATSAAAVLRPVAGEVDVAARDKWMHAVKVERNR